MKMFHRLVAAALGAVMLVCASDPSARSEPSDLGCPTLISALTEMRNNLTIPASLSGEDPVKRGGEFDPNNYFRAFTHLKMRDGFTVDYVYHRDGMGGYPILYARPVDQQPYVDEAAYRAAGDHPDFLQFVVPQDNPEGYFEFSAFAMTANQFYLDWHANYNDWQVVCGMEDLDKIINSTADRNSPGRPMSAQQQQQARAIQDKRPAVAMNDETATVTMVVFTKWGGFYRRTLVIDRRDHSIRDEQNQPLVDYDCGVAF
ncbi:hypothetical protein ORI20_13725 [Mycobacterium sp. CVI_P3]|uniref:Secreted protein n=1 Tax=Mycobacterium pinniadriaticum TaxID=2994102 RepID=A0ABT3SE28_9MYCO|nr:hypothetical protein [Mycobacterium pinniadriaticum]MCX2931339.1 hypothetical protein [Mycobacterium pinniadriaticum]MCX2937763.1 hypothetical protein [Mycobacterium pinniadriaticum]